MTASDASSTIQMPLPIDNLLPDICQALAQHNRMVLTADPGAGKTTRVPLALLEQASNGDGWLGDQMILMLEPRRMAARNAARFMAQQLGESVGETVGYRIRLESKSSAKTRILVVTEGILTRMLQSDPELSGIGLIIFDEFHERHLHSDLALALTHQCQQLLRDDLRMLVMSATLDTERLCNLLEAPLLQSEGRSFPVDIQYRPARNANERMEDLCIRVIQEALQQQPGYILVFLPGVSWINRIQNQLAERVSEQTLVLPLHGQLDDKQQAQALGPVEAHQRKVLLATNIAESSLTLDGVRMVIDSGLERRMEFSPRSGLSELKTRPISQASSIQRCGRAGRQAEGACYRLWTESEQNQRPAHHQAEILSTDLAPTLMELKQWGAEADELLWLDSPPASALAQAEQLLKQLGILDSDGSLSDHGRECAQTSLEPRLAHALVVSQQQGWGKQAANLIAVLQESGNDRTDDLERRLNRLTGSGSDKGPSGKTPGWVFRARTLAKRLVSAAPKWATEQETPSSTALICALAYPDRIGKIRQRGQSSYQLSQGSGAELNQYTDLHGHDWLAVAGLSGGSPNRIQLAAAMTQADIEQLLEICPWLASETVQIEWQEAGNLKAERQRLIGQLVLERQPLTNLSAEDWQSAWKQWFSKQAAHDQREGLFPNLKQLNWTPEAEQLRRRMALVRYHFPEDAMIPENTWPDVSDTGLIATLDDWLMPYLNQARHLRDLNKINLEQALVSLLDWPQQEALKELAPTHLPVPSGSRIAIDYPADPKHGEPVLAVKLQEMFGCEQQPTILKGRLPLLVHLLSPAKRPLQVTSDLPHFWRNTYAEVRKDMRGRYPKHPWPEDPLSAEATRLTKRALENRK